MGLWAWAWMCVCPRVWGGGGVAVCVCVCVCAWAYACVRSAQLCEQMRALITYVSKLRSVAAADAPQRSRGQSPPTAP